MKLTYAYIRGFRKFHLSKIHEFEAEFCSPVTIITAVNGYGKTSLLSELNPLPPNSKTYERNGKKELHLEHNGHLYKVISDFSSKSAPHSFLMDGTELNDGHTTDVQRELVARHFGITIPIRNLIYGKTEICRMTPAERKNLFLNINPMDLSLITPAFKEATNKFKGCKANLQLLYGRKADLESKMVPPEVLEQHIKTKEQLNNQILEIDKILYGLEQHITSLQDRYKSDLDYRQQCINNNRQLLPTQEILLQCKNIIRKVTSFTDIPRGDAFNIKRNELQIRKEQLSIHKNDIAKSIETISHEINEYQQHLDSAQSQPVSELEKEIAEVDKALEKFVDLPNNPLPEKEFQYYQNVAERLKEFLFAFVDSDTKLPNLDELKAKTAERNKYVETLNNLNAQLAFSKNQLEEVKKQITNQESRASIPDDCNSTICGLKNLFEEQLKKHKTAAEKLTTDIINLSNEASKYSEKLKTLNGFLQPIEEKHLEEKYVRIYTVLTQDPYLRWRDWSNELLDLINTQPLLIHKELVALIEGSQLYYEQQELLNRKKNLMNSLDTIMKQSGASLEFLKNKLKEKEERVRKYLNELKDVEHQANEVDATYALYLEYATAVDQVTKFQSLYDKGERALVVDQAITYWKNLGKKFLQAKSILSEDLRKIETIVQDQQVLRRSYTSETMNLVGKIEQDKKIYELVASALSPNSGFPHKSMVRYLNALINNVNGFMSQIWTYKMKFLPVPFDRNLDYKFRIEVGNEVADDLDDLSEGQTEMVNLVWMLTILLQMKILNNIPLYADELGRTFDSTHRLKLLNFLNQLIDNKYIEQLFLVSHYSEFTTGFTDSEVICLSPDEMPDIAQNVNEHVRLVLG